MTSWSQSLIDETVIKHEVNESTNLRSCSIVLLEADEIVVLRRV